MKRWVSLVFLVWYAIAFPSYTVAQFSPHDCLQAQEINGTNLGCYRQLIFSNGVTTNNGDGSLSVAGGSGVGDVSGAGSSTVGEIVTYGSTNGKVLGNSNAALSSDGTFGAASNSLVPTSLAVRTYVDGRVTGIQWKTSVRVATTVDGTLASAYENGDTVDGVVLATGDRILLKNQAVATVNGIYTVNASGAPTRATDADTGAEILNATVLVTAGTANAFTTWTNNNTSTPTLGSTNITFAQMNAGNVYTASTGLSLAGNAFSIDSTVATLTGTQVLTNKTLTSPILTTPIVGAATTGTVFTANGMIVSGTTTGGTLTISSRPTANDHSNQRYETTNVQGASTAGAPATGYLAPAEIIPHYINFFTNSGHNESLSINDGRTGQHVMHINYSGSHQGDVIPFFASGFGNGTLSGATHFLASPAIGAFAADLLVGANGIYLNPYEIVLKDGGFDAAAIGHVIRMKRTVNTAALGQVWIGFRAQQETGSNKAFDAGYQIAGATWKTGFDLTPATLDTTKVGIALKASDRIYFNASSTADAAGIKWYADTPGSLYLSYESGTGLMTSNDTGWIFGANGATNEVLTAQSQKRSGLVLNADTNASGNDGGAYVSLQTNNATKVATLSITDTAGQDGAGNTVTALAANEVGLINLQSGGVALGHTGVAVLHVISSKIGFFTSAPTYDFSMLGGSNRVIGVEFSTGGSAGGNMTLRSGGASTTTTNNVLGGNLLLIAAPSTGTAVPSTIRLQGGGASVTSSQTSHTIIDRFIPNGFKVLTDNSAVNLVNFTVANGTAMGAVIDYTIEVVDTAGTPTPQSETGRVYISSANSGGTVTSLATEVNSQQSLSSGTLSTTWAITNANPAVLSINADTSLTAATGYPRITYSIHNLGQQAIALQ